MQNNGSMAQLSSWTDAMSKSKAAPRQERKREPEINYENNFIDGGRELRANSSIERMETWTESMRKNPVPTKSPAKGGDDDYADEEFEDYDEDFEDEDYDTPAPAKVVERPQERPTAKPTPAPAPAPAKAPEPVDYPVRSQAKPTVSSSTSGSNHASTSARSKQFDNVQMSLSSIRMTDPRGLRVQRLLASGVMELAVEKATILNTPPSTPYELYMRNLRLPNAEIRQIGVPVEQDKRDMEINTDIIETSNKGVQFSYGDDTAFYRVLEDVRRRRATRNGRSATDRDAKNIPDDEESSASQFQDQTSALAAGGGATRLATFLQRASRLCEHVLDTVREAKESEESKFDSSAQGGRVTSLFDTSAAGGKSWQTMGTDKTNGANETVRTRRINGIRFSALQPHLLLTSHPYPTDENAELDLKPYKGLYCLWDAGNAGGPQYVLEGTGQPTACCFSATQAHLVLAGTQEGSLHLWDLREDSSLHKDRDAVDLRISRGIRKPAYSTSLPFLSLNTPSVSGGSGGGYGGAGGGLDGDGEEPSHSAPVVAVESLNPFPQHPFSSGGSGGGHGQQSVVSQFVSVDEAGLVIFWVTSEKGLSFLDTAAGPGGSAEDVQRAPWGGVVLVQTRQIHSHSHSLYRNPGLGASRSTKQGKGGGAVTEGPLAVACVPHDLGTLLVSGTEGEVRKVSRYGGSAAPTVYTRVRTPASEVCIVDETLAPRSASINEAKPKPREVRHFAAVSCMTVRAAPVGLPPAPTTTAGRYGAEERAESNEGGGWGYSSRAAMLPRAPLILVGRVDGTVDLFHMDDAAPVQTWDLTAFTPNSGRAVPSKGGKQSQRVVLLQWCTTRPGVFFACDAGGNVFHFDLLTTSAAPVTVETLGVSSTERATSGRTVALSPPRALTGGFYASTILPAQRMGEGDSLQVRRGNAQVTKSSAEKYDTEEATLYEALFRLSAQRAAGTTVLCVPPGMAVRNGNGAGEDNLARK